MTMEPLAIAFLSIAGAATLVLVGALVDSVRP